MFPEFLASLLFVSLFSVWVRHAGMQDTHKSVQIRPKAALTVLSPAWDHSQTASQNNNTLMFIFYWLYIISIFFFT